MVSNDRENNEALQRTELHRKIWAIAEHVRGAVDGLGFQTIYFRDIILQIHL